MGVCIICYFTNLNSQNTTPQDFNLPKNTILYVDALMQYNGETKQLTPTEQNQYDFKDGLLIKETSAKVIGTLKIGSQKLYTFNSNNELTNIDEMGGVVDVGTSSKNLKFTYSKSGQNLYIYKNGNSYLIKYFDAKGNLTQEDVYDAQSNYIFEKITYNNGAKTTTQYNSKQEPQHKTIEYLNSENNLALKVDFELRYASNVKVTTFTYDTYGNLTSTLMYMHDYKKVDPNFEYYKNGRVVQIPENAVTRKSEITTYYNYAENNLWTAQIVGKKITGNEIEVKIRAIQTSDGKMYNANNQAAFLAYLDATYQKIKAI